MGFADLTSPDAVVEAIRECEQMGEPAFLEDTEVRAIGDVKYKLLGAEWERSDLYEVVAFAAGYRVPQAVVATVRGARHAPTTGGSDRGSPRAPGLLAGRQLASRGGRPSAIREAASGLVPRPGRTGRSAPDRLFAPIMRRALSRRGSTNGVDGVFAYLA